MLPLPWLPDRWGQRESGSPFFCSPLSLSLPLLLLALQFHTTDFLGDRLGLTIFRTSAGSRRRKSIRLMEHRLPTLSVNRKPSESMIPFMICSPAIWPSLATSAP